MIGFKPFVLFYIGTQYIYAQYFALVFMKVKTKMWFAIRQNHIFIECWL